MSEAQVKVAGRLAEVLRILLIAVAVVSVFAAAYLLINRARFQDSGSVTVQISSDTSQEILNDVAHPAGTTLQPMDGQPEVWATLQSPLPVGLRLLSELGTVLWALCFGAIAFLLSQLLHDIYKGKPFAGRSARNLRWIALLILLASVGSDVLNWLAGQAVGSYLELAEPLGTGMQFSFVPFILAGVIFVLGDAFRRGQELAEETSGLV